MKLIVARVIPLALALLVPSYALAETPAAGNKPHKAHTQKRAKAAPKATKKAAPKVKAPKAAKKAIKTPKASKKASH